MKRFMKKALAVLLAVLMAASFASFPFAASAATKDKNKNYVEGEVIAVLEKGANKNYLLASKAASSYGKGIKLKNSFTFKRKNKSNLQVTVLKSSTLSTKEILKKLKNNANVKYAFPNYKKKATAVTNDSYSKFQWALDNTGQNGGTVDADVNADALWEKAASSDKEQIVAIADTGLDLENPEFKDLIWTNPYGAKLVGEHGYDFSGENADGVPRDGNGHGTHCAGIVAAAANNGQGIAGINQSNVKIMPVKWLTDDGYGDDENVLAAYEYISRAMDLGANVVAINNSWGGMGTIVEQMLYDEIFDEFGEKGAVSLIAAGNDGSNISEGEIDEDFSEFFGIEMSFIDVPACTNSNYALTVAATNEKDELADFSNYSVDYVDISAPGVDILSTVSYDCFNPTIYSDEKKAALVDKMQDYNGSLTEDSFGYPRTLKVDDKDFSDNISVSQDGISFGESGSSVTITVNDTFKKNQARMYAFEIPFTIEDETKPYSVSFMGCGKKEGVAYMFDVPADAKIEDVIEDSYPVAAFGGMGEGNFWTHCTADLNYFDEDGEPYDEDYVQAKERKLVFISEVNATGTTFTIDELAISKQDVDTADFERYDFYCGTSMATPYVTGAVALLKNVYPKASTRDIINMVKNTGREVEALKGKTENAKVLDLSHPEAIPPMIFSVSYNDKGAVEIEGSFKDITSVTVNGKAVKPTSIANDKIIVADNNYNTKKAAVTVTNANGADTYTTLLSKKTVYPNAADVVGMPSLPVGGFMLPAGSASYYINEYGEIGKIAYDNEMGAYVYEEGEIELDYETLFKNYDDDECVVTGAAYYNNKIFFTLLKPVVASNGIVIGVDNAFGYVDLKTEETKLLCEVPDDTLAGASLACLNGNFYVIGGFDGKSFVKTVYQYNASKKKFEKTSFNLPEGRAYTKFIQYENKLVGVYGAVESGKMPSVITFDGSKWASSKVSFDSDDYDELVVDKDHTLSIYDGNLGYGQNGVFCNGAYVYGRGDSFTYVVNGDKVNNSTYSSRNALSEPRIIGTTLPGCFVGFPAAQLSSGLSDIEDYRFKARGGVDYSDDDYDDDDFAILGFESAAYKISLKTSYAAVDASSVKNAKLATGKGKYAYGDKVTVTLKPSNGYVIESISAGGKVLSKNSNKATVTMNAAKVKLSVKTKYAAPAKVKNVKAVLDGENALVTWKKVKNAKGYQVQQYKNGKWKTVKTIKNAKTTKYTAKRVKKGTKFRVRAFGKYKGKTYYGKYSKAAKAK